MIPNQVKTIISWAKNIAQREREGDSRTKAEILEACEKLKLDWPSAEKRYELAQGGDLAKKEGIFFILTGKKYPNPKGYSWA